MTDDKNVYEVPKPGYWIMRDREITLYLNRSGLHPGDVVWLKSSDGITFQAVVRHVGFDHVHVTATHVEAGMI